MVYAPEYPTEELGHLDRLDGRSFFNGSIGFYLEFSDFFPARQVQIAYTQGQDSSQSILLDVSNPSEMFRWQLVTAHDKGTEIKEIDVNKKGQLSGWSASYNQAGRLRATEDINELSQVSIWQYIQGLIHSPGVYEQAAEWYNTREEIENELAQFATNQEVTILKPGDKLSSQAHVIRTFEDGHNGRTLAEVRVRVFRKAYQDELSRLQHRLSKLGFPQLNLHEKPALTEPNPYYWQNALFPAEVMLELINKPDQ